MASIYLSYATIDTYIKKQIRKTIQTLTITDICNYRLIHSMTYKSDCLLEMPFFCFSSYYLVWKMFLKHDFGFLPSFHMLKLFEPFESI